MANVKYDRATVDALVTAVYEGHSLSSAARLVGMSRSAANFWWRKIAPMDAVITRGRRGGLVPVLTSDDDLVVAARGHDCDRARVRRALTSEDRAVIAAGLRARLCPAQIAKLLGRDRSVISREIARNRNADGYYRHTSAQHQARVRRRRPKEFKLAQDPRLCARIESWMDDGWSPELIARVLRAEAGSSMMDRVSHETIYQSLYVQGRGSLRQDLHKQLSLKRSSRRSAATTDRRRASWVPEQYRISRRPAEANDRAVPGHWEGDLILGPANRSAIGVLVERSTRFTILLHLPGRHDAASVAAEMINQMSDLPAHLRRSLAWDRGTEMSKHEQIRLELAMPVFFCDPHAPWQRGSGENTNRLLRHWFAKGSDLSGHTREDLNTIAAKLNQRPRPTLDMQTPAQRLGQLLTKPAAA